MKKLFVLLIISVLLLGSFSNFVSAETAKYATAGDLYQAWEGICPDYVCGVWSTDGGINNLTFGVQNNEEGNAGKQEILELIENDSSVTFVYQEFSRNYLLQIQKEIDNEYMGKENGLVWTGLYDMDNCIKFGVKEEKKDDPKTQKMVEEILNKYGNAVGVEYTDGIFLFVEDNLPVYNNLHIYDSKEKDTQPFLILGIGLAVILMIGVFFVVVKRKNMMVLQTNIGTTASVSHKKVEDMIKESDCSFPSDLDKRIMSFLDEEK